jgi:hypothetical protein
MLETDALGACVKDGRGGEMGSCVVLLKYTEGDLVLSVLVGVEKVDCRREILVKDMLRNERRPGAWACL